MTSADFQTLLPEIVLALYAMIALIVAVYTGKDKLAATLVWATAGLFVALALYIGAGGAGESGWWRPTAGQTTAAPAAES